MMLSNGSRGVVTIFDTVFWTVLLISAIAGMVRAVIRIVRSLEEDNFKGSKAIAWFIRDTIAGMAAGFVAWLLSLAMNNDAGVLLLAFVAAFAGVPALEQVLRSQGYKAERDLLTQVAVEETDALELLKATKQELSVTQRRLREAEARLSILDRQEILPKQTQRSGTPLLRPLVDVTQVDLEDNVQLQEDNENNDQDKRQNSTSNK
jgi:hypothetical protein